MGVLLDDPAEVTAFKSRFEDEDVVLFCFWDVVWENIELESGWLYFFREGGGVFVIIDYCVDVIFCEDDGFNFPT